MLILYLCALCSLSLSLSLSSLMYSTFLFNFSLSPILFFFFFLLYCIYFFAVNFTLVSLSLCLSLSLFPDAPLFFNHALYFLHLSRSLFFISRILSSTIAVASFNICNPWCGCYYVVYIIYREAIWRSVRFLVSCRIYISQYYTTIHLRTIFQTSFLIYIKYNIQYNI
jgi:hypothetical protein